MRLIRRVSLRSVLRAAPACSSRGLFRTGEDGAVEQSRGGGGTQDAIRLLGILSSGLQSTLIACLFPSSSPLVPARVSGLHATADDHPMCVAGKNTGAMRDRATSTKDDTSRFRWRATSISGLWPDPLSATRCVPISSCERREWRWSILWQRCHPTGEERSLLAAWPIDMPANWLERVNQTDNAQELEALCRSVQRGRPFASRNGSRISRNVWA